MRRLSLEEWDQQVAPFLNTMQLRSGRVVRDTKQIKEWAESLPVRPDFVTEAEDLLERVERDLEMALSTVKEARAKYYAKERTS